MQSTEGEYVPCDDTNADDRSCVDESRNDDEDIAVDKSKNLTLSNIEHMWRHALEAK